MNVWRLLEWLMAPPAPSWDEHLATWLKRLVLQVVARQAEGQEQDLRVVNRALHDLVLRLQVWVRAKVGVRQAAVQCQYPSEFPEPSKRSCRDYGKFPGYFRLRPPSASNSQGKSPADKRLPGDSQGGDGFLPTSLQPPLTLIRTGGQEGACGQLVTSPTVRSWGQAAGSVLGFSGSQWWLSGP